MGFLTTIVIQVHHSHGGLFGLNDSPKKLTPEFFHVFGKKGKIPNPKKVKGSWNLPTIIFEGAILVSGSVYLFSHDIYHKNPK